MLLCVIDTSSSNPVASVGSAAEPWDLSLGCPGHLKPFSGSPGCFCPGLGAISCPGAQLHITQPWHTTSSLPVGKTQTAGYRHFPISYPALFLPVLPCFREVLSPRWCPKVVATPGQFNGCVGARALQQLDMQGSANSSLSRAWGYHRPEMVLEGDQLEPS